MSEGAAVGQTVFTGVQIVANRLNGVARYIATGYIPAPTLFRADPATGKLSVWVVR